jgi:hypothetical protein
MSGCSLADAFPDTSTQSGRIAKKEERRRAKMCGGPALTFLKAADDPDRVAERPMPPPEKMQGSSVDVIGSKKVGSGEGRSYFGKSEEDSFADFSASLTDNPGYTLQNQGSGALTQGSDFNSFEKTGLDKAAGVAPSNIWNLGTDKASASGPCLRADRPAPDSFDRGEKEALLRKLDILFARLEDIESRRNDYAHSEVTLFILSGLFLMFGMETLRKFR